MAKPLTSAVPSSAVARLLEPGVARAALVEAPGGTPKPPEQTGETPDIKREFILTQIADDALGHLTALYSKATSGRAQGPGPRHARNREAGLADREAQAPEQCAGQGGRARGVRKAARGVLACGPAGLPADGVRLTV